MRRISLLLIAVLIASGCSRQQRSGTVRVKGSDTMVNLAQAWTEAYIKEHPSANIIVTGGGSGVGIAALINGDTDIATASRAMEPQELSQSKAKGLDPQQFTVARDGVTVIVNPKNPVSNFNIDQLSDIYTGKITNWKQVGGKDAKMVVLSRDKNSGTHVFFLEHVVRKGNPKGTQEYAPTVLMEVSTQAIADEVAQNVNAVGYVGMGYVKPGVHKALGIASDATKKYVEPTVANVINGAYPIARPLYLYTPSKPMGAVKEFIDFVLSDQGQKIVAKMDFVPLRSAK